MKSFFKKLAFVMAMAMVVSLAAPAAKPAFAATEFTYAEQESGAKITTLNLKIGEEVDLKFKGVADYKSYPLKWVSADEEVATVDQKGVVTAVANGTTTVELQVGDGTVYTSQKVVVNVADEFLVELGTAKDNTFDTYELTMGDSVDLNFYGVKDWAAGRFTCTWSTLHVADTEDEAAVIVERAVVDQMGVVTPVAPGEVCVIVSIIDNVVGTEYYGRVWISVVEPVLPTEEPTPEPTEVPVEPTEVPAEPTEVPAEPTEIPAEPTEVPAEPTEVPAEPTEVPAEPTEVPAEPTEIPEPTATPVPDKSFTVEQKATDTVEVTFADTKEATANIELYKVVTTTTGSVEINWPATVTLKNGVATVKAYVPFDNGDEVLVRTADHKEGFVSYVGEVDRIEVIPTINGKQATYADESNAPAIKFEVKYYSGKIEVAAKTGSWMTFEPLVQNDDIYVDPTGMSSYIYKVGAKTTVKAIYSYYDAEYNTKEVTYEFDMTGTPAPVEAIGSISGFTLTDTTETVTGDASKVKWGNTQLIVGDKGYKVALKLDTTTGNKSVVGNVPAKDGDNALDAYDDSLGTISFKSSDETKLLVGTYDGTVNGITEGSAVIIVSLTTTDANGNSVTKNIAAYPVTVKEARKATTVKLSPSTVTVLTADNDGGKQAKATIEYEVVDQYGDTFKADNAVVKTTANVKNSAASTLTVTGSNDGKGKIEVDGTLYAEDNLSSITYTVEVAGKKVNLNVVPKKPAMKDGKVTITGYSIDAPSVDLNVKSDKLTGNDLNLTISSYTLWSGMKTGYVGNVLLFDNDKFFTQNKTEGIDIGNLVLKVTGPDGLVTTGLTVDPDTGVVTFKVADYSGKLDAVKTGRYTVDLYQVTNVTKNTGAASGSSLIANKRLTSTSFEIKNTCTKLSVKSYGNSEGKLATNANTLKAAVVDVVKLQGISGFEFTADKVDKVTGVYNAGSNKYYIGSVDVQVPINNTGAYFIQTISVGKTIDVPAGFDIEN